MSNTINKDDLKLIEERLGRFPRGLHSIKKRDIKGNPLVISVLPIVDSSPFPTNYWLICPQLKKEISRLEQHGEITKVQTKINADIALNQKLIDSHLAYQKDRKILSQYLNEADQKLYSNNNWEKLGIGGIRDWHFIKCLHLHYGHYLATGENIVGEIIEKEYGLLKNVETVSR